MDADLHNGPAIIIPLNSHLWSSLRRPRESHKVSGILLFNMKHHGGNKVLFHHSGAEFLISFLLEPRVVEEA